MTLTAPLAALGRQVLGALAAIGQVTLFALTGISHIFRPPWYPRDTHRSEVPHPRQRIVHNTPGWTPRAVRAGPPRVGCPDVVVATITALIRAALDGPLGEGSGPSRNG